MSTALHEYHVGMTCAGCAEAVERVLNKIKDKGIQHVDINLSGQTVVVTTSLPALEVLEVIKKTGKTAEYLRTIS